MNVLTGTIVELETVGDMTLVTADTLGQHVKSIVLETPATAPYLKMGSSTKILFKETEVILGRGDNLVISLQNRFECTVKQIEKGDLLTRLVLDINSIEIVSIITTNAVDQLHLEVGDAVVAMVKTNEIMLSQ